MLKFLTSTFFRVIRVTGLFVCAIWLLVPPVTCLVAYAQNKDQRDELNRQYIQDIQNEHRFSVLETKINDIDGRTSFMQNSMWGLVVGMSGLLGERGIAIAKQRKQKSSSTEESN